MTQVSASIDYRALLDTYRPTTLLSLIPEDAPASLGVYRAEALLDLDRAQEARQYLDPLVGQLEGDAFAVAERLWAQVLLRQGLYDGAIIAANSALQAAQRDDLRAMALSSAAVGFAYKRCWNLAENRLRAALEFDPNNPHVMIAQARLRLEADQRIEARKAYERMAQSELPWVQAYSHWGLSHVSYLLGEFEQARQHGETALAFSDEIVLPFYVLGQVALAKQDLAYLEYIVSELERRSPQAEGLPGLKVELEKLRDRLASLKDPARQHERRRLEAFPTLVQRRDYCGPSTVELVLRYWRGGVELSNDQIAESVKFPQSGTPIYRMREFFHLVGYDTVRPLVPIEKLKKLIEAGYPVIIQEEFANSSHVAVVIGFDEVNRAVELQDPMTHIVTSTAYEEFDHLRRSYLNSGIVAFPRGQGHDQALARLNLFDNQVVVWTDQAVLEMDQSRPEKAAEQMRRAVRRLPAHALSWIMLLHAEMEQWRAARLHVVYPTGTLAARLGEKADETPKAASQRFYDILEQARKFHPQAEFIFQFEGNAALMENDIPRALAAFQRACELDPDDARNYASIAECHFSLREFDQAQEAAWKSLQRDQGLVAANAWVARCLVELAGDHAEHYATVAVELAPDWWLAHLALAEAHRAEKNIEAARREVETALSLSSGNPEVLVLRGELLSQAGDAANAAIDAQAVLESPLPRGLNTNYKAHQLLCRLMFGSGLYEDARMQIKKLFALTPGDPWAAQFQIAAECEALIENEITLEEEQLADLRQRYEQAIQMNKGETWVVSDYLEYLHTLAGSQAALEAASQMRQTYPENGNLVYLHGIFQSKAGEGIAAAQTMLEALSLPDGVRNRDELSNIFNLVLDGLGLEAGENALLDAPVQEGSAPAAERRRALGLALAMRESSRADRARELLRSAVENDPDDAYAWMRLGDVVESDVEQETCYRRALMTAPNWAFARANLARFLVHQDRFDEALEFTSGYESRSLEVLVAHGQALVGVGYFEEAAEVFARAIEETEKPWQSLFYDKWYAEMECGWHEAALETAHKAHQLFPQESLWYLRIEQALQELDRLEQAWSVLEEGQKNGLDETEALRAQFELAWRETDEETAWGIVEQLLKFEEDDEPAPTRLTWAEEKMFTLLIEAGRLDDAQRMLSEKQLDADGWGGAAWSAMLSDEHAFTLELAERALELSEGHYAGLYTRAQALSDLGREEQALQAFLLLRETHPEEHNAYEKLALYTAADGQLDDALELADQGVLLGPYCPFAWAVRGYVYFVRGQPVEAQSDLLIAWTRANPRRRAKTPLYWWLLGVLQNDQGLAEEMRQATLEQAETALDRRLIAQVDASFQ